MSHELGAWLRQQRQARGWPVPEMARQLRKAAAAAGDGLPGVGSLCHNIRRWEHGEGGPSERYRLHYCKAFGILPGQFGTGWASGDTPGPAAITAGGCERPAASSGQLACYAMPVPAVSGLRVSDVAYRWGEEPNLGGSTAQREVLMTAHEGSEHAERAERRDIGEATLEQLRADVARLSAESMTGEPFTLFLEMRRVRDRIYRLLDQRLWPRDQADLYFLLGCLADLMAVAASELGYPQAAEELIRSGWAYATVIDHHPLMAHVRLQSACISYWHGRPRQALDLAEDGLRYLRDGPNAAHLHAQCAKAAARIGDAEGARRAIAAARDAREREYTDDLLAIGGEFSLSLATQHYVAGSALTEVAGAQSEAADELARAIASYDAGPGPDEQHWFAGRPLASIDLSAIRLRSGALDAAAAALEPVLSLPGSRRITALTTRLALVRTELAQPIYQRSAQARDLDERIEDFGRESITASLHSLPSPG